MKAVLINAEKKVVSLVDVPSGEDELRAIYSFLGCDCIASAGVLGRYPDGYLDTLFVDDEGLIRDEVKYGFGFSHAPGHVLAGNGIIMGTDPMGDSSDCRLTMAEIVPLVRFTEFNEDNPAPKPDFTIHSW